jgi:hypothetical protein
MGFNGYTIKPASEFSEYQKKIETIDNVILCVAEAEIMLREIGASLVPDNIGTLCNNKKRRKPVSSRRIGRINAFR